MTDRVTCAGITKAGRRCQSTILRDGLCRYHDGTDIAEMGRLGGLKAGEVRREQGKGVRERLRDKLEARADEIAEVLIAAGREDWRALVAALAEAYGRPDASFAITARTAEAPEIEQDAAMQARLLEKLAAAGLVLALPGPDAEDAS